MNPRGGPAIWPRRRSSVALGRPRGFGGPIDAREQGVEPPARDPEEPRGVGLVPAGPLQRRVDQLALEPVEAEALADELPRAAAARPDRPDREEAGLDVGVTRQDERPLQGVLELAHVPRPPVGDEPLPRRP